MPETLRLKKTIGPSHPTTPEDAVAAKAALARLGHYEIPDFGITPYPDSALFDGLRNFQQEQELKVDGLMKPDGRRPSASASSLRKPPKKTASCPLCVIIQTQIQPQMLRP